MIYYTKTLICNKTKIFLTETEVDFLLVASKGGGNNEPAKQ